jgi:ADP-heptose:LPS heptosyltransferase
MTALLSLIERLIPEHVPPLSTAAIRRLLVVDLNFLGDMVMSSPVYRSLKTALPAATIDACVLDIAAPAVESNPYVDRIFPIHGRSPWRILRSAWRLRRNNYDLVLQLNTSLTVNAALLCAGKRYRLGYNYAHRGCLNNIRIPIAHRSAKSGNRIDECLQLIEKAFGWRITDRRPLFVFPDQAGRDVSKLLLSHGVRRDDLIIGFHTNCRQGQELRRWGHRQFSELANRLYSRYQSWIVFTGGADDRTYVESITRDIRPDARVIDLTGRISLQQFAALLTQLSVFGTVNTGPMHIAYAVDAPTVGIIGGTPASIVFPAGNPRFLCVEDPALRSWDPSALIYRYVPAISQIRVDEVETLVHRLLETVPASPEARRNAWAAS